MPRVSPSAADAGARDASAGRFGAVPMWIGAVAVGSGAAALATGASALGAVLIAGLAVAALIAERRAGRHAATEQLDLTSRSARSEGQRAAAAQLMSLELAHERARSVFEALSEGVLVVDPTGEIVLANPAARRALHVQGLEPVGRLLWEALAPELARQAREVWQALRDRDQTDEQPAQLRRSGLPCQDRVYDLTAVAARSKRTGQDFGFVFLLVDTTRSHELQRLKERFLSSVSHELRTPLTNVCAYSEILLHILPGESVEWPEFVRIIHQEGLQLSRIVDTMFDYLQIESGEGVFAPETLDGAAVVGQVVAQFRGEAERCEVVLEMVTSGEVPYICIDRRRLEQVVRHLLDNAIKFTPRHGRVRVTVGPRDGGWHLCVDDSGPGIPLRDRRAVFDKFSQLHDHMTGKPPGTGIGLAASRAIVSRSGGLIWCQESVLGGAAFVVLLPAVGQPPLRDQDQREQRQTAAGHDDRLSISCLG